MILLSPWLLPHWLCLKFCFVPDCLSKKDYQFYKCFAEDCGDQLLSISPSSMKLRNLIETEFVGTCNLPATKSKRKRRSGNIDSYNIQVDDTIDNLSINVVSDAKNADINLYDSGKFNVENFLSASPSACPSACPSAYPSACLSACLSFCPACLSPCHLSVCLTVCLSNTANFN